MRRCHTGLMLILIVSLGASVAAVTATAAEAPAGRREKTPPRQGSPGIRVEKSVDATSVLPGTEVTYGYRVTNVGDALLRGIVVTDDKLGRIGTLDRLAHGESRTFTRKAVISDNTLNVVEVVGRDPAGQKVSDSDEVLIEVFLPLTGGEQSGGRGPAEGRAADVPGDSRSPAAARMMGEGSLLGAAVLGAAALLRWRRERRASHRA